jgi:putative oxygen-independent coproporphyrinogen III oxidase
VISATVYVHVPFCVVKCGYCDFNSFTADDESALDRFLDGLHQELNLVTLPETPISVFFGGGTPSYLDPERLVRMFAITGRRLNLRGCDEVTMEANPESVTVEKAKLALDAGVNRVSVGAQSFDARYLKFLDRAHDADQTKVAFAAFRQAGFENISLDLMFGIPGQTVEEWESDLRTALALGPDHLSCYNLTFEPGTRLTRDLKQGKVAPNPDEQDLEMFRLTRQLLAEAGFHAYETSNFAGRGGPCLHNDHYWRQGDYVGVGPGASDHRQGVRSTNLKPLDAWAQSLSRGIRPTASAETLSNPQRAAEALWLGLRRTEGLDLRQLSKRLKIDTAAHFAAPLEKLLGEGLLTRQGDRLTLTPQGQIFGNTVGEAFLGH